MVPYVRVIFLLDTKILSGDANTTELFDPFRVSDL